MKKLTVLLALCLSLVGVGAHAEDTKAIDNAGETSEQSVMQWLGTELQKLGTTLKEMVYPDEQSGSEEFQTGAVPSTTVEEKGNTAIISTATEKAEQALQEEMKAELGSLKN